MAETFIRRHMVDLLPGGTVVMVATADKPHCGHWDVPCPVLVLDRIHGDYFGTVERFLTEHGVQVCLGECLDQSLPWLDVAERLGIRFVGHAHGYDVSEPLLHRLRAGHLNYSRADGLITVSGVTRTCLIQFGLEPAKVHVIPCRVDVPPEPGWRVDRDAVRCPP